jgi:hypothetical protein
MGSGSAERISAKAVPVPDCSVVECVLMVSSETCSEMKSKPGPPSITGMRSALLSLLTAAGLAGCDRADTADYRVFVEENRLLVSSVEALMAVPAVPRKQKA